METPWLLYLRCSPSLAWDLAPQATLTKKKRAASKTEMKPELMGQRSRNSRTQTAGLSCMFRHSKGVGNRIFFSPKHISSF